MAVNDVETTNEDTAVNIRVLTNDTGGPAQISISSSWYGSATVNNAGTPSDFTDDSIDFDPDEDYFGPDADVWYALYDGVEYSGLAQVVITVNSVNDAPVAVADTDISTSEDQSVSVYVLGDDSDVESDPLTIIVTAATNGTATVNNNGTPSDPADDWVDFVPTAEFSGSAQFNYKVNDGTVDSAVVTVPVNVTPVNDAPVAADDNSITTLEDTLVNINVLGNDSDAEGDPLQISNLSATNGTATINDGGTPLDYTDDTVDFLPDQDYYGTTTFSYDLYDGTDYSGTANVSITVNSVNDAPVAVADTDISTSEDQSVSVYVLGDDSDVEGDPLTIIVTAATNGTATVNNNGTPSDPADDWVDFVPTAEFSGSAQFNYKVNDGTVDSAVVTVPVNVTSVNDAPVAADDNSITTLEDTLVNINVLANDSDAEGDPLQISNLSATIGTATVNNGGTPLDYTDDKVDFLPDQDYYGTVDLSYNLYDGTDYSGTANVSITVTSVNDAPVAVADTGIATSEDQSVSVYVLGDDSDVEGDPLTIIVTAATNGTATVNNNGTPSDPTDDWVDFVPTAEFSGPAQFDYKVNDGTVDSAVVTVPVDVTSVGCETGSCGNSPPVFDPPLNIKVVENTTHVLTLTATDIDGDTVLFSITGGSDSAHFELSSGNNLRFVAPPDYETPTDDNANGVYVVRVTADDQQGAFVEHGILVEVIDRESVNAPVFSQDEYVFTISEDAEIGDEIGEVPASDLDVGDTMSRSMTGSTNQLLDDIGIDSLLGKIKVHGVLDYESRPWYIRTAMVTDSFGLTDTAQVRIIVQNVADEPVFTATPYSATVLENAAGGTTVGTFTATDPQTQTITYALSGGDGKFAIDSASGAVTVAGDLDFETTSSYTVQLSATDTDNNTSTANLNIAISNIPEHPVFAQDPYADVTVAEDKPVGHPVQTVSATDPQSTASAYSLTGGDGKFTVDAMTGAITVNAGLDYETNTEHELTLTATDPDGNEGTSSLKVIVGDVDDRPVVSPATTVVTIEENTAAGSVASFSATDPQGQPVTDWSLSGGDGKFDIDNAGNVTQLGNLDFEEKQTYTITVTAKDPDGNTGIATGTSAAPVLTVNVTDVPDNPVIDPVTDPTVSEGAAINSSVVTITATDPNSGDTIMFSLSGGDGHFSIDPTSGVVTLTTALDYVVKKSHEVTVTATDNGGFADDVTFTVNVGKVNVAPVFAEDVFAFTISEGGKKKLRIGKTAATDANGDDLTYSITGGSGQSYVEYVDNELKLKNDLPLTSTLSYSLSVTVTDSSSATDTATVNITLKPLVAIAGDFKAVESNGDVIELEFARYSHDLTDELEFAYTVTWTSASSDDFQNPTALVDAGQLERTLRFEAGQDVISVALLPVIDSTPEGLEKLKVALNTSDNYTIPTGSQGVVDKKDADARGFNAANLIIVDGVTLFGPNNIHPVRADNNSLGVHWNDLNQGSIGDCYCLAALGAMAQTQAQALHDLFTDNGDGTVSLWFFETIGGPATTVTVSMTLDHGRLESDLSGDTNDDGDHEIWPIIFEKAYRKFKFDVLGESMTGGFSDEVWGHILGTTHERLTLSTDFSSDDDLRTRLQSALSNGLVVANTSVANNLDVGGKLFAPHAYVVTAYDDKGTTDEADDEITLFNPHGLGTVSGNLTLEPSLTFAELKTKIKTLSMNP